MHFLPKGDIAAEGTKVKREVGATRPLGLMNTDAKVVQASVAYGLAEHVARNARRKFEKLLSPQAICIDCRGDGHEDADLGAG